MPKGRAKIRLKLWKKNPKCYVCKEKIIDFKDSSIEHVLPRSKGGKNNQRNLAISHRHCNSLRRDILCPVVLKYQHFDAFRKLKFKCAVKAWKEKLSLAYLDWIESKKLEET